MGDTPNIGTTHKRQKERKAAREFQDREQEQHTAFCEHRSKRRGGGCLSSQTINVKPHRAKFPNELISD